MIEIIFTKSNKFEFKELVSYFTIHEDEDSLTQICLVHGYYDDCFIEKFTKNLPPSDTRIVI
jgi:hypothetical protein